LTLDDIRNNVDFSSIEEQQYQQECQQQMQGYVPQSAMVPQGQGFNPFAPRVNNSWDAVMADRLLTVKRPDKPISGTVWLTEAGLSETFSLITIGKVEQEDIMDEFYRIQMMASGELNRKIVDSRQDRLLARILTYKARVDILEGGNINERGWWGTSVQKIDQRITQPQPQRPQGFLATIADGLSRR